MTGDDDTYQSNGEDSGSDEENALDKDFVKAGQLYDDIMKDPDVDVVEEVLSSKALWRIMDKLTEEKYSMENHRTAKLWLQYMEMIGILRMFIKAERTGDWALLSNYPSNATIFYSSRP